MIYINIKILFKGVYKFECSHDLLLSWSVHSNALATGGNRDANTGKCFVYAILLLLQHVKYNFLLFNNSSVLHHEYIAQIINVIKIMCRSSSSPQCAEWECTIPNRTHQEGITYYILRLIATYRYDRTYMFLVQFLYHSMGCIYYISMTWQYTCIYILFWTVRRSACRYRARYVADRVIAAMFNS